MRWHTHTYIAFVLICTCCVCVHVSRSPFCVLQVYPRRRRRDQRKRWASATRTKQRHFSSLHVCVCVSALALCAVFTLWNREISTEKRAHTNAANAGRRRWAELDTHSKYTHMHTVKSMYIYRCNHRQRVVAIIDFGVLPCKLRYKCWLT